MTRILTRDDVEQVLSMGDCIEAVDEAQRAFSAGTTIMPVRLTTTVPDRGVHLSMPALLASMNAFGLKCITIFPSNPTRGAATLMGVVILNDPDTGRPLAIMDAAYLTGVRTAAASAVATRALARPDCTTLALIGGGVQAMTHLWAMTEVRPITSARVVTRSAASADKFVAAARERFPDVEVIRADDYEQAIRGADIVCATSSAKEPVTDRSWIADGCHINGVGSHSPSTREIDGTTMRDARVVVDSRDANMSECGDCMIPIAEGLFGPEHVADEIGEVLLGTKPGRTSAEEITVYQSCGIAIQDVATARLVATRAAEAGLGVEVEL